jgi:hypothetical protein
MDVKELKAVLDNHRLWIETRFDNNAKGCRAYLSEADLSGAYLSEAYLRRADLSGADLRRADLIGAYLSEAYLIGADLSGAYLIGADLRRADLSGALIDDKTKFSAFQICPEKGSFTAFKKVQNNVILELQIPTSAKRTSSLVGRKCRASKAKVLCAWVDGKKVKSGIFYSKHNSDFAYEIGKTVTADSFDPDIRIECTNGIHFFITRKEAEEY